MLLPEKILIATRNKGKVKEFAELLGSIGIQVESLLDYEIDLLPEVVEDGETFAENAMKKARTIAEILAVPVLADDSGLCVDKLGGAPGVYSARFAGMAATDELNNAKLIAELQRDCEPRQAADLHHTAGSEAESFHGSNQLPGSQARLLSRARFLCALVLYMPSTGTSLTVEGGCDGYIISEPRGEQGFGYDPYFYVTEYDKTMAELSSSDKNAISHRGKAIQKLIERLKREEKLY